MGVDEVMGCIGGGGVVWEEMSVWVGDGAYGLVSRADGVVTLDGWECWESDVLDGMMMNGLGGEWGWEFERDCRRGRI